MFELIEEYEKASFARLIIIMGRVVERIESSKREGAEVASLK